MSKKPDTQNLRRVQTVVERPYPLSAPSLGTKTRDVNGSLPCHRHQTDSLASSLDFDQEAR